jgi:hypothetical protein
MIFTSFMPFINALVYPPHNVFLGAGTAGFGQTLSFG